MHNKASIIGTGIMLLICSLFFELYAQVKVKGYYRKDGTYVSPHTRSRPDGNPYNNYSFPGNYNPNTGKISTGNPETYLRNYYNRNSNSSPTYSTSSTSSNHASESSNDNEKIYHTDNQTSSNLNSLFVDLSSTIKRNEDYNIDIQLLNDLIISLQNLKTQILSKNKSSNLTTAFNNDSDQSSSIRYDKVYYIIVYSERTTELAKSRVQEFELHSISNGYELKILSAVVNGIQWYRVALGEFGTYVEAREKLSQISTSIPDDSWILKGYQ